MRCALLLLLSPRAEESAAPGKLFAALEPGVTPCAEKAAVMVSCDMMAPSRPAMTCACSLRGLVAGEFTKLVLREC